ncbi:MAG: hypothetical protein QW438_06030 [Ignisphaera sp.]
MMKRIFMVGLILWSLTLITSLNFIIVLMSVRYAFTVNFNLLPLLYIVVAVVMIVVSKIYKISSKVYLFLWFFQLGVCFSIAWYISIAWGLLSSKTLLDILLYSVVFSTIFTVVSISISIYAYRRKHRDAKDIINEAVDM